MKTQNWTVQNVRDFGVHRHKYYVFIKLLPLEVQGSEEEEAERFKSQRWCMTPRKWCLPGTTELILV